MSETYPKKNHCETLFAGHTPSSVGIGCKGSEKFAMYQIYDEVFLNYELCLFWGLIDELDELDELEGN